MASGLNHSSWWSSVPYSVAESALSAYGHAMERKYPGYFPLCENDLD